MFSYQLYEKSKSQSQQKLMGMAYAYKKGDLDLSKLDKPLQDKIKKISKMSKNDLRDFAKTKHKGLPKKVEKKESP